MKKIDDSKLYLFSALVMLVAGLAPGAVSYYSILHVEPKVEKFLAATENIDKNYKKAYLILRDPQIFAGYSNFDAEGVSVKNSLAYFDKKIFSGEEIDASRKAYIEILLERRKKGSILGRNTMFFFLILSLSALILFFQERKSAKS